MKRKLPTLAGLLIAIIAGLIAGRNFQPVEPDPLGGATVSFVGGRWKPTLTLVHLVQQIAL